MTACASPVGLMRDVVTGSSYVVPCRKEQCGSCGRRRRASFIRRTLQATHLCRELTVTSPYTEPTRENLARLSKCFRESKRWLDRQKGRQGRPAWGLEAGEKSGHWHKHGIVGDYGYVDFKKYHRWLISRGYYVVVAGRRVPWRTRYRFLRDKDRASVYALAAYASKQLAGIRLPRWTRIRYAPIPETRRKPNGQWEFVRLPSVITTLPPVSEHDLGSVQMRGVTTGTACVTTGSTHHPVLTAFRRDDECAETATAVSSCPASASGDSDFPTGTGCSPSLLATRYEVGGQRMTVAEILLSLSTDVVHSRGGTEEGDMR